VPTLAETSLSAAERAVVEKFLVVLRERLGERLQSVWLFGSRARGQEPGPESDVDLLIVSEGGSKHDGPVVDDVMWNVAWAADENPFAYTTIVWSPEWLEHRREIESFFIQEVDRDKVVLYGKP
jgi:hypothetical protein